MNGCSGWSYAPYMPFDQRQDALKPYICRLAPYETELQLQWFDRGAPDAEHSLHYALRGSNDWKSLPLKKSAVTLQNLQRDAEYELFVCRADGTKSNFRLARTGPVEGTIVNYLHPEDPQYSFMGQYLCSPAITRLDSGALIATMDVFRQDGPRNLSLVFRSADDGATWEYLTDLFPCFWGTPFSHRGRLYMLSVSNKYGDLLLGCSDDEGKTWGAPVVLMRGACINTCKGFHRAPMPVISHRGRLWVSLDFGGWESKIFETTLVSVDEHADLMNPENWVFSEPLPHDSAWENADAIPGGLEGNAVPAPDGNMVHLLRYGENKALMLKNDAEHPHASAKFCRVLPFPMGHTKFEVRRHPNGTYYAVGNLLPGRNVLALYTSKDLETWEHHSNIADYSHLPREFNAFQYPAFLINGEHELLVLSRTALNGANSFHNNNYVTFHRVKI